VTSKVECNRLKGIMVEKKITQERLAKMAGISENSLARKINGHRDFWYWEVVLITRLLGFKTINEVFPEIYEACSCRRKHVSCKTTRGGLHIL